MLFDFRISAMVLLGLAGMACSASAQPISGSFQATCRNIRTYGTALTADCADPSGHYHTSSIGINSCRGDIGNNNGVLFCNTGNVGPGNGRNEGSSFDAQVSGSFQRTCRNIQVSRGILAAECRDPSGHYHGSSLAYAQCNGDIGNNNGALFCNGAMGGNGRNGPDNSGPSYGGNGQDGRDPSGSRYGDQGRGR